MKGTKFVFLIALSFLALSTVRSSCADGALASVRVLKASSSKVLSVPAFGSWGFPQCDASGNLYYHAASDVNASSVLKLAPDGSRYAFYTLPAELAKDSWLIDFRVTPSGEVWLLDGYQDGSMRIFRVTADSTAAEKTKLDVPSNLRLRDFVAFPSGTKLVTGNFTKSASSDLRGKSYAALFDASGRLIRRLSLSLQDLNLSESKGKMLSHAATLADDGYLYLLDGNKITIVSETGTISKTLFFNKPDEKSVATKLEVSGSFIAVQLYEDVGLGKPFRAKYLLLDRQSGAVSALYEPTADMGNNEICFSSQDGFTFENVEEGRMKLIVAAIK